MNKYLLDTQALLFIRMNKDIPKKIISILENEENLVFFSIVSLWEIAIKISNKKNLDLGISFEEFVESTVSQGIEILELKPSHLYELYKLPKYHKDPFDRLLIAQTLREDLICISNDKIFDKYLIKRVWQH